jgi:arabinogalactan oligomer / maltooligosaccharide transport system substrate-binding protein
MTLKPLLTLFTATLALGAAQAQTLTVWTHFQDESLGWLEGEVAGFQAAFGTEVELVYVPVNEIVQNMLLNAPEGQGPDLIATIPHDQLGQLAEAGVLASMEQFATPEYVEDLTEQSRLAFTLGGQLYGLPTGISSPKAPIPLKTCSPRRLS